MHNGDGAALLRLALENLAALAALSGAWIDRVHERKPPGGIVLDMDSSESPTHGQQEGSAWNGPFGCTCYHPLFVFNQIGDLERCLLRPGNAHSADDWHTVLEPVIARYRERRVELYFRADAAFAKPELYETLEAEEIRYAIRLPANRVPMARIRTSSRAATPTSWCAATRPPEIRPVLSSTTGAVRDAARRRPRMRWPMLE
jgi:hypothetical protein